MRYYLTCTANERVLKARLGQHIRLGSLDYGQTVVRNGVRLTFYPAGHILGSAQVLVEYQGERWVVSGDYKVTPDPTCTAFEPVQCHVFITESTFGLPLYQWQADTRVLAQIRRWWAECQEAGRTAVLFGYSLGKTQRILADLSTEQGPILVHPAVEAMNEAYRSTGIWLPDTTVQPTDTTDLNKALLVSPPGGKLWLGTAVRDYTTGFASGWMALHKAARKSGYDHTFALSDHADWKGLLWAIQQTGAEKVFVTHGFSQPLVSYLNDNGIAEAAVW
jgi:putative mRNA 3-end processing factor